MKRTFKALGLLLAVLIPGMLVHRLVLEWLKAAITLQEYAIGYGINFFMAATIIVLLLHLPERYKTSLGYFFLFGSLLKFIVYFTIILPLFKIDGELSKTEFFAFFVPYFLCLVVETSVLIAKLKRDDQAN